MAKRYLIVEIDIDNPDADRVLSEVAADISYLIHEGTENGSLCGYRQADNLTTIGNELGKAH